METPTPVFGLKPNPLGRLSMIRNLKLDFKIGDAEHEAVQRRCPTHSIVTMEDMTKTWLDFIHQSKIIDGPDHVCFSALDTLELDFSRWGSDTESLDVSRTAGDATQVA